MQNIFFFLQVKESEEAYVKHNFQLVSSLRHCYTDSHSSYLNQPPKFLLYVYLNQTMTSYRTDFWFVENQKYAYE